MTTDYEDSLQLRPLELQLLDQSGHVLVRVVKHQVRKQFQGCVKTAGTIEVGLLDCL